MYPCFASWLYFCTLLDTLWGVFRASGALVPSKRQGFREPGGPGLAKGGVSSRLGPHITFS